MKPICQLTIACMATLLVACTGSSKIYLPDGSSGYKISCPRDPFNDTSTAAHGKCLDQAGKTCGNRGYRTLNTGDSYMIIQCNPRTDTSSATTSTSATFAHLFDHALTTPTSTDFTSTSTTFVDLPDHKIGARLLGTWECSMDMDVAEAHVSSQSVTTYARGGKYTAVSNISIQSKSRDNPPDFSIINSGDWLVENGRLIAIFRNVQVRGQGLAADAFRQVLPKPGDEVAIRFTALTDTWAVGMSELSYGDKQYCRKQPG